MILEEEDSDSADDRNVALKEKNRQSAQRSRDNKKKYIVSLELRLEEMENENQELRQRLAEAEHKNRILEAKLGQDHPTIQSASTTL